MKNIFYCICLTLFFGISHDMQGVKKKKQKIGIKGMLANAGSAMVAIPKAATHSKAAQRFIKKARKCGNSILAVGPQTVRYASSEAGQHQIKSVVKNGLHYGFQYGVPIAGIIGGVKYLDNRGERRSAEHHQNVCNLFTQLTKTVQAIQNDQQQLKNDLQQSLEGSFKSEIGNLQGDQRAGNTVIGNLKDGVDSTNERLAEAINNFKALLTYFKREHGVKVNAEIQSTDGAYNYCAEHLRADLKIQSILGYNEFKVCPLEQIVGKDGILYAVRPVEIVKEAHEFPAALIQKGNKSYQNTINQANIQKAASIDRNVPLLFWYKDESSQKGYGVISVLNENKEE